MKDVGKSLDTAMAKEPNVVMEGITWRITGKEYERGRELLRGEEEGFRLLRMALSVSETKDHKRKVRKQLPIEAPC